MTDTDPTLIGAILTEILEILPHLEDLQLAMLAIGLQNEIDRRAKISENENEKPKCQRRDLIRRVK